MFSIIIPTFNNLNYLKVCLNSIQKNSFFKHQIILHVNVGNDGTKEFLELENIDFTYTNFNAGICEGVNKASNKAKHDYILYAHDDFYFCPNWDKVLFDEVKKISHNKFYLSGIMMNNGPIKFNCGDTLENFDEKKLLNNYKSYNHFDFQGSTWAPHLISKELWNTVGGFSEEFYPGTGSDPDLNMKLWLEGVRIFKGLNDCKVYHFGSIVTRKYKDHPTIVTESGSRGGKIFLLKWGFSIKFFKKRYLRSDEQYISKLNEPTKDISFYISLFFNKINYLYLKLVFKI
ncbi:glycosyltransferase [Candidatus Pelagibacter sp.]|jgi:glycosyltransferase involved in cell wall biosynthesis|nr:glycosyltransferase [Candidatus Pelagibacter sp.]